MDPKTYVPYIAAGGGLMGIQTSRSLPTRCPIAVITPTRGRARYHETLWRTFDAQTYPFRELWVLDDSDEPSSFFARMQDARLHYEWIPAGAPLVTGDKRNLLLYRAQAPVIAQFDDDDWYAPTYLEIMLQRMHRADADFVTLRNWNERIESSGEMYTFEPQHECEIWGWGFTYMFRRSVVSRVSFPSLVRGQDWPFAHAVRSAGLKTLLIEDGAAWVAHGLHA
jgi:glycosyltransferase involved in cell wall biosynthesis